jgi:hypothetical protein
MSAKTFTVAASVQDPLTSERLVQLLQAASVDAFSRAGGAASSAPFGATTGACWDILVSTDGLSLAKTLIAEELERMLRDGPANALAAEEEAMAGAASTKD